MRSLRKSISYSISYAFDILYFKVKVSNSYNLSSNKASRKICSSMVELSNKNFCISFQDKIDSIQLILKSLKILKNSLIFSLSSIIVIFHLIPDSTFILRDLLFAMLIELSYYISLSIKAYIYSNIDFILFWSILDLVQYRH